MSGFLITDEMILAAARALNALSAKVCEVDADDQWYWHSDGFKEEARIALEAAKEAAQ